MAAHPRRAMHDGPLDHLCATRINVFHREIAFIAATAAIASAHAAMVVPAAAEQTGLVEMDMRVDEAGQGEPAADIDLGRLAGQPWFDGGDTPLAMPISTGVAEARVRALRKMRSKAVLVFIAPRRVGGSPQPSERRFPGHLQIVCSFEARLFKICACSLMG